MKKLVFSMIMATLLAGCSGSKPAEPPMPIDINPSDALKFVRAMNFRAITDAGNNYLIYNTMASNGLVYPLESPVTKEHDGELQTTGRGSADAVAGSITNTGFIPVLSILTSRRARPVFDGMPYIGSWTDKDIKIENAEIVGLVAKTLTQMKGFHESGICHNGDTQVGFLFDGHAVAIGGTKLPQPPIETEGDLKLYNFGYCFFGLATLEENQAVLKAMSEKLGKHRALFIPGSHAHPPVVYSNGQQFDFR